MVPVRRVRNQVVAVQQQVQKEESVEREIVRNLPHGLQTQCFRLPLPGKWYIFTRTQTGRFMYGFRRTSVNQLMLVDVWNEKHTLLIDDTPPDQRVAIPNSRIFDIFALAPDRLLAYWQQNEAPRDLMCSEITINFASRSFSTRNTAMGSIAVDFDNEFYQELITPLKTANNKIDLILFRMPTRRSLLLFSLEKRTTLRRIRLEQDELSEIFRTYHYRDADGVQWLYTWDDASHFTNAQPLDMPKINRARFEVPFEEVEVDEGENFPHVDLQMERIACTQEPKIDARLFRRTAVQFHEHSAFVLFRAIVMIARQGVSPPYYRLFHVDMRTNAWMELKFADDFFCRIPPHMPQSFESLAVRDGVIELLLLFNKQTFAHHNHFIMPPINYFGNLAFGWVLGCRIPFKQPETLSAISFFNLDHRQEHTIPKTFRGRALF